MKWIALFVCMVICPMEMQRFTAKQQQLYRECYRIRARLLEANHGIFSCDYFLQSAISLYLRLEKSKEADDLLEYFERTNFSFDH